MKNHNLATLSENELRMIFSAIGFLIATIYGELEYNTDWTWNKKIVVSV